MYQASFIRPFRCLSVNPSSQILLKSPNRISMSVARTTLNVLEKATHTCEIFAARLTHKQYVSIIAWPEVDVTDVANANVVIEMLLDPSLAHAAPGLQVDQHAREGRELAIADRALGVRVVVDDEVLRKCVSYGGHLSKRLRALYHSEVVGILKNSCADMAGTVGDVVFQVASEVVVVFKDLFADLTPGVASRRSAVLQERLFGFEGALTWWAVEDLSLSIDDNCCGHVRQLGIR